LLFPLGKISVAIGVDTGDHEGGDEYTRNEPYEA
jgi:hypothetical protein